MPIQPARAAAALVLALAAVAITACETPGGKVSTLQSSSVALTPGSTYAWAPVDTAARSGADPRVANDIIQERLRIAVDTALAAKGFRQVADPAQATLLVAYHVGLQNQTETRVETFGGGGTACGFRGCVHGWGVYGPPSVDVSNINYTQGTVILDLIDRASGKLAWRATSEKRVDQNDATQAGMNAIFADMTKSLPRPGA